MFQIRIHADPHWLGILDQDQDLLIAIPGSLPEPARRPPGCRFSSRCPLAVAACSEAMPLLESVTPGHAAACIRIKEGV